MADFAAVLKKTFEKMGDTTPEMRAKVYEKARETIKRQIDAMEKTPPQAAIDRQFEKLEDAIKGIEDELAPAIDTLDDVFEEFEPQETVVEPELETTAFAEPVPASIVDEVAAAGAAPTVPASGLEIGPEESARDISELAGDVAADVMPQVSIETASDAIMPKAEIDPLEAFLNEEAANSSSPVESPIDDLKETAGQTYDDVLGEITAGDPTITKTASLSVSELDDFIAGAPGKLPRPDIGIVEKKSGLGGVLKLLAIVGVLGAGGYLAYDNRDQISNTWVNSVVPWWQNLTSGKDKPGELTSANDGTLPVRTVTTTTIVDNGAAVVETPTATPPPENVVTDVSGAEPTVKFTQRLTEEGAEVDDGPVVTNDASAGEGSSLSPQTASTATAPAIEEQPAPVVAEQPTQAPPATETAQATPVGQRAIFYEERSSNQEGTALAGATVWSVVNAEPGGDLAIEPAIKAETTIPELGIKMEMTIRRNGDKTFPASHIIELFFRVPDTFDGRGIADVQRITFKTNEQDPGNALIAVPAPLDQNIFLIALTDAATAIQTNVNLMRRENWIDIPMQYTSGRRALITFEKGIPGEKVFNDVFAAWDAAPIN
ncbi:MAG: hypothetical protein U5K75_03815 [Ahrensia sp.]|nr:hypothetical protein [Ahrensia sp.]